MVYRVLPDAVLALHATYILFVVLGGTRGYAGSFLERYLLPFVYPGELTLGLQLALGLGVIFVNGLLYALILRNPRVRSGAARRLSPHPSGDCDRPGRRVVVSPATVRSIMHSPLRESLGDAPRPVRPLDGSAASVVSRCLG